MRTYVQHEINFTTLQIYHQILNQRGSERYLANSVRVSLFIFTHLAPKATIYRGHTYRPETI